MTWFKVDDKLHSHKKAARAGVAAMGLWTVAGSWSADHLSDGFVPDYIAHRLAPGEADDLAARLVTAGLWTPDEHDGDKGWRFNDWGDYQPTRDDVESKREYERDKKRNQRRNKGGRFEASLGESLGDNDRDTPRESLRPVPSRPEPTPTQDQSQEREPSRKRSDRATRLPEDWTPDPEPELVTAIGGQSAAKREWDKFVDHWRSAPGAKGRKVDWQATWRNWLRRASEGRGGQQQARHDGLVM